MSSTFADLVQRVETSNLELVKIRETIVEESIDSTTSILDQLSQGGGVYKRDMLQDTEEKLEGDNLQLQQLSFLESMTNYLQGIYNGIMSIDNREENAGLFDFMKIAGGVAVGDQLGGDDSGGKDRNYGGMLSGFLKRLLGLIGVGFVANELMRFLFDKSLTDLPKMISEWFDKKIDELMAFDFSSVDWGTFFNDAIDTGIKFIFGKGTIESALSTAGVLGSLGFLFFGPMGVLIGTVMGLILGSIDENDVISLKNTIVNGFKDTILAVWQMTFGDFGTEAAKVKVNSIDNNIMSKVAEGSIEKTSDGQYVLTERGKRDPGAKYMLEQYYNMQIDQGKDFAVLKQIQDQLKEKLAEAETERNAIEVLQTTYEEAKARGDGTYDFQLVTDPSSPFLHSGVANPAGILEMVERNREEFEELKDEIAALRAQEGKLMQSVVNSSDNSQTAVTNINAISQAAWEAPLRSQK